MFEMIKKEFVQEKDVEVERASRSGLVVVGY